MKGGSIGNAGDGVPYGRVCRTVWPRALPVPYKKPSPTTAAVIKKRSVGNAGPGVPQVRRTCKAYPVTASGGGNAGDGVPYGRVCRTVCPRVLPVPNKTQRPPPRRSSKKSVGNAVPGVPQVRRTCKAYQSPPPAFRRCGAPAKRTQSPPPAVGTPGTAFPTGECVGQFASGCYPSQIKPIDYLRGKTTRVLLAFRLVQCPTVCLRVLPGGGQGD